MGVAGFRAGAVGGRRRCVQWGRGRWWTKEEGRRGRQNSSVGDFEKGIFAPLVPVVYHNYFSLPMVQKIHGRSL
jgi:hypothetical protein